MGIVETEGIITREVKYGDTSRILTVITREFGKISVLAGGVRTNKSGLLAATQLFSYVSFNLFKGREKSLYKINSGEILSSFDRIRESLDRMAYASYFCDITNCVVQENAPEPEQLSLLLNALFMLAGDKAPYEQVKAVFEFRTLAIAGLLPDMTVCRQCGSGETLAYLDPAEGCVFCAPCGKSRSPGTIHAGSAVLGAVSYISLAEPKKIFSFQLSPSSQAYLSRLGEYCTELYLERHFKTLDYLKKVAALEG